MWQPQGFRCSNGAALSKTGFGEHVSPRARARLYLIHRTNPGAADLPRVSGGIWGYFLSVWNDESRYHHLSVTDNGKRGKDEGWDAQKQEAKPQHKLRGAAVPRAFRARAR